MYKPTLKAILKAYKPPAESIQATMQFHQAQYQPHTYIVENDYGTQLGTVDEFHRNEKVSYIATRFTGPIVGMPMPFEQKDFTAALQFVSGK